MWNKPKSVDLANRPFASQDTCMRCTYLKGLTLFKEEIYLQLHYMTDSGEVTGMKYGSYRYENKEDYDDVVLSKIGQMQERGFFVLDDQKLIRSERVISIRYDIVKEYKRYEA